MLIIALAGGTEARRDSIAQALIQEGKARLAIFSLRYPEFGPRRAEVLENAIWGIRGGRFPSGGLILPHIKTADEESLVRARGGYLCHVDGQPSEVVSILPSDLMVTADPDGQRHYLSPLELLSEVRQRYDAARTVAAMRATVAEGC